MKQNKLKLELETQEADRILIGYVNTIEEVEPLLENLGDVYAKVIDENISLLSEDNMSIEELTSCPIIQNWEGAMAVIGTWSQGNQEELIF
jgi:hypothetical protein